MDRRASHERAGSGSGSRSQAFGEASDATEEAGAQSLGNSRRSRGLQADEDDPSAIVALTRMGKRSDQARGFPTFRERPNSAAIALGGDVVEAGHFSPLNEP